MKQKETIVVRKGISKAAADSIYNKAVAKQFEFIAIAPSKENPNLFNITACEKMWDKAMQSMFDVSRNTAPVKHKKESEASMPKKQKIDLSDLAPKALIKAAYDEEKKDVALGEVQARIARVHVVYALYNPEDKFKSKGDASDLTAQALVKMWQSNDEKKVAAAEESVLDWLTLDAKLIKSV